MGANRRGVSSYAGMRRQVSLALLVIVNLLPILCVLFLQWDVAALMVLYWSENLVLGFFTLVKMLSKSFTRGLGMGAFFLIHYGGFCAGHGVFILSLLLKQGNFDPTPEDTWPFFLVFPQMLWEVIKAVLDYAPQAWIYAFIGLFISHGASFLSNFLFGRERDQTTVGDLMTAPYGRIVILHIAIILGGIAVMAMGQPLFMLLVLVLAKLALDVKLHLREHEKVAAAGTTAVETAAVDTTV